MIQVVLFDLGLTLVDGEDRPFPHVKEALQTIQSFVTANGTPLVSGLVSDFDMPVPPATRARIDAIFKRYLVVLDHTGLRPFFEPVRRRVTLSTHAGVFKPDRAIFETALTRLQLNASLQACLFITESQDHIRVARTELHMSTLRFRNHASTEGEFDDWLQAPAMVAHLLNPAGGPNAEAALGQHLRLAHGFDLHETDRPARQGATTTVRGTLWKPVGTSAGDELADVHAPFPVEGTVTRGSAGEIRAVRFSQPGPADLAEAAAFVRSLARHGQIRGSSHPLGDAATHDIETDDQGRRKLVRTRFEAM